MKHRGLESVKVCTAPSSPSVCFIHPSSEGVLFYAAAAVRPSATGPGCVFSLEQFSSAAKARSMSSRRTCRHRQLPQATKRRGSGSSTRAFSFCFPPGISARRISHRRVCTGPSGLIPFGWPSGQVSFGWIPIIVPILPQLVARGRDPAASSLLATRPESRVSNMNREYDLFENFPDGSRVWRAAIVGRDAALAKLKELASKSANEVFAMHLPTEEILAKMEGTKDTS
jgi:hypothetical protein